MPQLKTIHNREEWDQALASLPLAHALQSWEWGEFKARWDWSAERLLWTEAGTPFAAAQVLRRSIPRTPWSFLYVAKGPALDYTDLTLAGPVLTDLEHYARQAGALFIKIDPDVPLYYGEPETGQAADVRGQAFRDMLVRRGWRFSTEQIQFRNTVTIDLRPEVDDLLAAMKSKWRYNIRLAERRGVTVRPGTPADMPGFYDMYAETALRDGFLIRPRAYYEDVWQRFLETGQAELWLASVAEEPVAGVVLFVFGGTAWYMYGASTGRHRSFMPNHLLQWTALCQAKMRGCTRYDMWGAPDIFDESDSMWGVYRFKQGFGGQVVQGLGAFDYPVQPALYKTFMVTMPKARAWLRRVRERI